MYIVNDGHTIDDGKAMHHPGDEVEFEEKDAKRLLKLGVIRPAGDSGKAEKTGPSGNNPPSKIELIVKAISTLPIDDQSSWTSSGKPQAAVLSEILGENVSAGERDEAWQLYQERNQ